MAISVNNVELRLEYRDTSQRFHFIYHLQQPKNDTQPQTPTVYVYEGRLFATLVKCLPNDEDVCLVVENGALSVETGNFYLKLEPFK